MFKEKSKAFSVHLALSLFTAVLVVALVFFFWYPRPLHEAVGVTQIFILMLGIDVLLGPCLTFLVFDTRKKNLYIDLFVIVVIQFSALGYGISAVAQGRPVWLVFNNDRFDLARALDVDSRFLDQALSQFQRPSWFGPRWAGALAPEDMPRRNRLILESVAGGPDLPQRIDLYVPLDAVKSQMIARSKPLAELARFNTETSIATRLREWPEADSWLPLMAPRQPMVVLMKEGEALGVVDLRPWL